MVVSCMSCTIPSRVIPVSNSESENNTKEETVRFPGYDFYRSLYFPYPSCCLSSTCDPRNQSEACHRNDTSISFKHLPSKGI
jgi:hypothetical protein